jgi:hypothetical protein
MRRLRRGAPCRVAIPGHARLAGPDAPGEAVRAGTGTERGGLRRLAPPPMAPRGLDIRRLIPHAIHLPWAMVEAKGPGPDIDGGPGERAHLPDAPPTAPPPQQHRPIPPPIEDPEPTAPVVFRPRLGQGLGHHHLMAAPGDGVLGHPAVVLQAGQEPVAALEDGVDGRWRAPRLVGGVAPGRDVISSGRGEILIAVRLPACRDQPAEAVEPINGGLERGGGIRSRLQMLQVCYAQLLVVLTPKMPASRLGKVLETIHASLLLYPPWISTESMELRLDGLHN